MTNPLLDQWTTPYETPPFDLINITHFRPALEASINEASRSIEGITRNSESPTFENTIEALDRSCEKIGRIAAILFNLNNADILQKFI